MTLDDLADELRRAYSGDLSGDDELLAWRHCLPVVQERWRRVAKQAARYSRRKFT